MNTEDTRRHFFKKAFIIGGIGSATSFIFPLDVFANSDFNSKRNKQIRDCFFENLRRGRKIMHRMIIVGDPHWRDDHISTAHPRLGIYANNTHSKERFNMMINWLNEDTGSEKTDFIVFNGDVSTNNPDYLPLCKEQFDRLNTKYYVVHGNHDHSSEELWQNLWGYGRNYSFENGNYGIVLMNSANEKGGYECADSEWLQKQLNVFKNKTGIIVFCHIFQHDNEMMGGVNCPQVTEVLFNSDNVKMAVYSHIHTQDAHYAIRKGAKQINTFFTGHFSAWGLPYLGYRVIEIYEDGQIGTYVYNPQNVTVINYNML